MGGELDFSGKSVLVVGGSSGIGNGIAQAFRAHGAQVHVCGTRASAADYAGTPGSNLDGLGYTQLDAGDIGSIERWAPGFDRLDVLVLSHSHTDHIGGLPQVLQAVTVDEVWLSPNPDPAENTRWVHEQLRAHGVPWSQVQAGESLRQDGSTGPDNSSAPGKEEVARVLWPRRVNTRAGEANAQSIALHINVAGGVLVLSDLTAESQDRMIRDQSVAADVAEVRTVVVAHHGSADQSSRLAERVTAGIALISVGADSYGHPSKRALQLYGDSRAYDTATCGAIALNSQGEVTSRCEDLDTTTAK